MKSLHAKYVEEREGKELIEEVYGFVKYSYGEDNDGENFCYLEDLFILPSYRRKGNATNLQRDVLINAKERGCKSLFCSIDTDGNGVDGSMRVILANNFKFSSIVGNEIFFKKEL
jgi:GNAT superfamily N-acetyltransferase